MNKYGFLAIALIVVFLAGCNGNQTTNETSSPSGELRLSSKLEDTSISPGDSTTLRLSVSNYYDNDLKDVSVEVNPIITGVDYNIGGPKVVEANKTEKWDVEISTSQGIYERTYNIYPIVCFDYSQKKIGYFRVANGQPSKSVEFNKEDSGPLSINIEGLQSADVNEDDKLNIKVSFSLNNNIFGAEPTYKDISDIKLLSGRFTLDTVQGKLNLKTNEGSVGNKMNNNPSTHICLDQGNTGIQLCQFDSTADYDASNSFDFDILLPDPKDLDNELESVFTVQVGYRFCVKMTPLDITVKED